MKKLVFDLTEILSVLKPPRHENLRKGLIRLALTPTFSLLGSPFRNSALLTFCS